MNSHTVACGGVFGIAAAGVSVVAPAVGADGDPVDPVDPVDAIDAIVLAGLAMGDTGAACCRALTVKESGGTGPASERVVFKDRDVDACGQ